MGFFSSILFIFFVSFSIIQWQFENCTKIYFSAAAFHLKINWIQFGQPELDAICYSLALNIEMNFNLFNSIEITSNFRYFML